jgi:hypothetical protein
MMLFISNEIFKFQNCSLNYMSSQDKDFGSRSSAKTQRDKQAEPSFNPSRLLTGSSTRILKYVEELKRGTNAEACPPHRQRHLRLAGWAKRLF